MPETDLALLIDAAKEAGRIATKYNGRSAKSWEKPDGAGPVTEADIAVNRMLEDKLLAERPDYGWLSEESEEENNRRGRTHAFIIDPIDGTRSFMEGAETWAHSLAVVENCKVTAAAVYLPMMDRLYTASAGSGAFLNGAPIMASRRESLEGAKVLATRPTFDRQNWVTVPNVTRFHRPSLAFRLTLVAEGRFDAMLSLRPTWEWDIAAGSLIIEEARAKTSDRAGKPLLFNSLNARTDGIVAGNEHLHDALMSSLA